MKALVIGATGATGKDLVDILLKDPVYSQVTIFVRRTTGLAHAKLKEVVTNFDKQEEVLDSISGDVLFSCLGTTLKIAGSKENQKHIDLEIPAKFAELAKSKGVSKAVLLSAYGASPASSVFYSMLKGELEEIMTRLNFDQLVIFKPGLLLRKDTNRFGEKFAGGALKFLNAVGLIRKYKPLPTAVLAEKLAKAPKVFPDGKHVIELQKIFEL